MRFRLAIMAAACAVPLIAHAQPIQGIYGSVGGGARFPLATKNTSPVPGFGGGFNVDQNLGYDARIGLGYALGNGWRFEVEGTFGESSVKRVSGTAFPATATGTVRDLGVMANAMFDLDVGSPYVFTYLGLGAGYQSTRLNGFAATRQDNATTFSASGDTGGFAAQVIAGVSFPVPNMPGLSVTTDYRLVDILAGGRISGAGGSGAVKLQNQLVHSVILGVRYAFNTPMPAALAAAAPAPAAPSQPMSYLVFFGLDKATLDGRAQGVVREAAQAAVRGQHTRIEVTGNTDTSGNVRYNQALSERRAKAVAAGLVGDGVPRDAIAIRAFGDTRPLTPTGPGVEQPKNRRVEIVIR